MRIVKGRAEMPTSLRQLPENNKLDYDHEHSLAQMFSHLVWTVLHDQIDPYQGSTSVRWLCHKVHVGRCSSSSHQFTVARIGWRVSRTTWFWARRREAELRPD